MIAERRRDPFLPALLLQAGLLLCGMMGAVLLPTRGEADEFADFVVGITCLGAMGLQNTIMRLILNNLPPTTVMTGNITQVLSDIVAYVCRFPSIRHTTDEKIILERQAQRMLITVSGFLMGAVVAAFACPWLAGYSLGLPILAILCLIPFGRQTLHAAGIQQA
jgi:uncharacterized membrane protein YoaK (UPF0700 family)